MHEEQVDKEKQLLRSYGRRELVSYGGGVGRGRWNWIERDEGGEHHFIRFYEVLKFNVLNLIL